MHKSKARKEPLRLERLMNAAAISAFVLGFLVWTERLNYILGGAVQIAILTADGLLIYSFHKLPQKKQSEALLLTEFAFGLETLSSIFLRQSYAYICLEPHWPVPALTLFLALAASLTPPFRRLRGKIRLLPHALVLTILLFTFSFLWTDAVNASLDFHPAQEVAAECIDRRISPGGRGAPRYWIKLAFPLSDGSRTTHWFNVTHPQYFEDSYLLLRRPGALGITWYEPFFPE